MFVLRLPSRLPLYRRVLARGLSSLRQDPSIFVQGLTKAKSETDDVTLAYLQANYPIAFQEKAEQQPSVPIFKSNDFESKTVPDVSYELNIRPLTCYLRDSEKEAGSRSSEWLREEKMIPGLLYGGDPSLGIRSDQPESKILIKTPWRLLQAELDRYHRSFESRVYDLTILEHPDDDSSGTVHRVIPQSVQRHPVKETIYCANFCRYHAGRPIRLPLVYVNEEESPALKRDGFIIPIQRYVECFVGEGTPIPERLELECTNLQFKEVIRVDRLLLPDNVRLSDRVLKRGDDFILGVVHGKNRGGTTDD
jgi:ribosomal protein L25 (general stress protein Ctc)